MNKRVLMITNYFYPDVASLGQLMTELCEGLQDYYDITVIAAFPNYTGYLPEEYIGKSFVKEKYKKINILRVAVPTVDKNRKLSRLKYIISYFMNSIIAVVVSGKQDLIFTTSQPPIIGGILGVIAKFLKRAKLVYNIQDFNPEQTEAVRFVKNRFVTWFARKLDNISCRLSDTVVVVGRDMRDTLLKRFNRKKVPNHTVVNNWIDEKTIQPLSNSHPKVLEFKEQYGLLNKFIFMYSGNIGLFYDLENIMKVIREFKDDGDIVFAFVGEGAVKDKLIYYCTGNKINNVRFIPYQSKENLIYSLNAADVHLVMNAKGIKGVSVPSKIYGIMAVNKPIIGILEKDSEARNIIEDSGCGYCCEPGDYNTFSNILKLFIDSNINIQSVQNKGRMFLEKNFTRESSIQKYHELFYDLMK